MTLLSTHLTTWILLCFHNLIVAEKDCISFDEFATCTNLLQVTALPPKIETLVITGGSLRTVPGYSFSHLPNLIELNIQHMHIGIIEKDAFSHLLKLDILSISNTNMSVIETGAFRGLRGLSSLDISQCQIDAIELKAFSDIDNIMDISVKTSNISFIDICAFYNFSSIRIFQFYGNIVSVVKASAFSEWTDVMNAIVNSNTFGRLECMKDSLFTAAKSFSFSMNQLECECHLLWILASSFLKDKLLSNVCHIPGTQESLGMSSVSLGDLKCPVDPSSALMGCPNRPDKTAVSSTIEIIAATFVLSPLPPRITRDLTTDLPTTECTGCTTYHQTPPSRTATHFTRVSMSSHSFSHVTSSTELPTSYPSTTGQSSSVSLHAISTPTLLITAAITGSCSRK